MAGIGAKPSLENIRAHAQKLIDEGISSGKIIPDSEAAAAAAAVPSFSAGTIALDPNTGRPTGVHEAAPAVIDSTTNIPVETGDAETDAGAQAAAAGAAEAPPQEKTRDERGKFTSDKPKDAPAKAPKSVPKTQEARGQAAEAAAADVLDEWADFEDLVFEHDDGSKYTVRAKKAEAKQVERFNRRQAIVDRETNYLRKYKQTLEPLIASGQIDGIFPILQRALTDRAFGDFVFQAYNRAQTGLPLEGISPQVVAAPTPGAVEPKAAAVPLPEISDPYLAEAIGPVIQPLMQELAQFRAQQSEWQRQQQSQAEQQQRAAQERAQRQAQIGAAHQDLARMYPAQFTGDLVRDQAALNAVVKYARDAGYVDPQMYGIRGGIVFAAQRMAADRADTGSPAAEMLAQVDRAALRAANAQAASARSVAGGTPSAPAPKPKAPPQPPQTRDSQGKIKNARQMMEENQRYAAELAAM